MLYVRRIPKIRRNKISPSLVFWGIDDSLGDLRISRWWMYKLRYYGILQYPVVWSMNPSSVCPEDKKFRAHRWYKYLPSRTKSHTGMPNLHCIISLRNSFLEAFSITQHTGHRVREILGTKHWEQIDRKLSWIILTYIPNNLPWETKENHGWFDIMITGFLAEITSSEASWIWSTSTTETRRKRRDVGIT